MRVMLGMSGGVDSAVAALLLKQQGYEVVGVFMKNWEEEGEGGACSAAADYEDARAVAEAIDIPCYTVNFAKEYQERVFSYFLSQYERGRTPNPDIMCNSEIKFRAFLDLSRGADAAWLATGHYARVSREGGVTRLLRAADAGKDQTYFLAGLCQEQLKDVLFPIGGLQKKEVRQIAREHGLINADKRDSTGICFIGERDFKQFLMQFLPAKPGDIVDEAGKRLGRHDGLMYYTLGQRKGLNIGGVSGSSGEPFFVISKDLEKNRLIVQQGEQAALYSSALHTQCVNWIQGVPPGASFECTAKFRYRQPDQPVTVYVSGAGARVRFHAPQRAVTPGQWVVFYDGEECLGGGEIEATEPI